jgi:hypothetical protein
MTTDKARKRAVRQRMTKTGESYTTARRYLADAATTAAPASTPVESAPLPPRLAEPEVSEAAVLAGTGRTWDDWFRLLDARGIEGFDHRSTAAWLRGEVGLASWWSQTVTVGFERARGLRHVHQRPDGFSVGVTRTIEASAERLFESLVDETQRRSTLETDDLGLRTATPARTARFDAEPAGSRVLVSLESKGPGRTSVTVEHGRLPSAESVELTRALWKMRLARLSDTLTRS